MQARRTFAVLACAALTGCGARSPLATLGASGTGGASGTSSATGTGGGAPPSHCPAALEPGAPTPMLGDCPTRTYHTSFIGPSSPHVTATATLGMTQSIPTLAVDAMGRAYVAQESPADPSVLEILRVDPSGAIAWNTPRPGSQAGTPILGADGNLRLVHFTETSEPELLVLSPDGTSIVPTPLPNDSVTVSPLDSLDPAVGADGSLYLLLSEGPGGMGKVAKVTPTGTPSWRSEQYTGYATGIALGPVDQAVAVVDEISSPEQARVLALDPATGATRWSREIMGQPVAGPAVRGDGTIVVVNNVQGNGVVSVLSPADGSTVWSADTAAVAGIWCAVDADGAVIALSGYVEGGPVQTTITAFEPGGAMRWQQVFPEQLYYSGTIDGSGQLLLAGSAPFAVDVATGTTRWTLAAPGAGCVWPMTMSTGGVLVGVQCDGTFFTAGD